MWRTATLLERGSLSFQSCANREVVETRRKQHIAERELAVGYAAGDTGQHEPSRCQVVDRVVRGLLSSTLTLLDLPHDCNGPIDADFRVLVILASATDGLALRKA